MAPFHQQAAIYRPHQTSETGRQKLTQSQMLTAEFVASDWNCLTMAPFLWLWQQRPFSCAGKVHTASALKATSEFILHEPTRGLSADILKCS